MNRSSNASHGSSSSLIDAAALQSDISRRFGLKIRPRRLYSSSTTNNRADSKSSSSSTTLARSNNRSHAESKLQQTYNQQQQSQLTRCNTCQYEQIFRRGEACERCGTFPSGQLRSNNNNTDSTLAERRGLVATKVKPTFQSLSLNDWDAVEMEARVRHDAFCPICMEGFSNGCEVLLSCSHIFHRTCLHHTHAHIM